MSSDTNIWETGVNDNGNGTDNNQYFISDTSDTVKRLTIQRGTGNIGIGTNEPSQLLDVSGNINLSGNIYLSNTGTIYKNDIEYAGGSEGGEGGATVWQENGTKIHYNAGNVGINTSDPTEALEVVGNIKATSLEGTGTNITALDAGNITSGTISNAILPTNISATNISATNISGDGSGITNLDATQLTGIISNNRLPTNISATNISATNISGDGSGITNLDATQLTGIIDNNRLPTDISITGDLTAKNLNVTGSTTTIYTDTYQTENLEIVSTGADVPSLKITHNTTSSINIMQVTDTTGTQSLTMTHDGNIGIGTHNPLAPLHIYDTSDVLKVSNSEITINRSILPETNDSVDIGSAERKIRDMYISDNSLWIGDDHKLSVSSDGKMKFRKRRTSTLPKVLRDASGDDGAAVAYINSLHGTSYQNVTELKLNHVLSYAKTINPEYKTSDIFGDETEDYDQDTAADAWQINNSKIYLGSGYTNIGIGTNDPDPNFKLHVDGNVHTDGTISADDITIKGSAETGSGAIKLNCETNFHGVTIKGPPHEYNQSYTLTLPSTAPEASKVLSTDESGKLSWVEQTSGGDYYTKAEINSAGYLTSHQSLNNYYTKAEINSAGYLTSHQSLDDYYNKTEINDDYYNKTEINSAGYLTSHQSLELYALKTDLTTFYTQNEIHDLLYDMLHGNANSLQNRIVTLENTHDTDITNVNNKIDTLEFPTGVPADLLVAFPPAELIFTSHYTTIHIGAHRNFTTQLKETKDNTNWNYITYNGVGYGTNNTFNAYENDSITINGSYFWSYPSDSYHLGSIYTSLLYVKKNSPVTMNILAGIGNVSTNVEGKVGITNISGDFHYSGRPNQNTTVSAQVQYTFPKNINPEYEFRIFHGGIIEWADRDTFISNAAYVVIITRAADSIINNDTIEDLPIEKVKFQNTTGFLKITNGNLSYDTTVSYLEEKINMILEHLDLND